MTSETSQMSSDVRLVKPDEGSSGKQRGREVKNRLKTEGQLHKKQNQLKSADNYKNELEQRRKEPTDAENAVNADNIGCDYDHLALRSQRMNSLVANDESEYSGMESTYDMCSNKTSWTDQEMAEGQGNIYDHAKSVHVPNGHADTSFYSSMDRNGKRTDVNEDDNEYSTAQTESVYSNFGKDETYDHL